MKLKYYSNLFKMSEEEQGAIDELIEEHGDKIKSELRIYMKDKMTDKKHMDYDRLCEMTESDRVAEIDDSEKLDPASNIFHEAITDKVGSVLRPVNFPS